MRSIYPR